MVDWYNVFNVLPQNPRSDESIASYITDYTVYGKKYFNDVYYGERKTKVE